MGIEEPMIGIRVAGSCLEDCADRAIVVHLEVDGPAARHHYPFHDRAGREDPGELVDRGCRFIGYIVVEQDSVGCIAFSALNIAVVNTGIEVARVMLGGDKVNAIMPVGGVLEVAVHVSDTRIRVGQLPAI